MTTWFPLTIENQGLPSPEQRNIKLGKTLLIVGLESFADRPFDQIDSSWLIAVAASQRRD